MGDWLHKRGIIKEVGILKIMKARFLSGKEITNNEREKITKSLHVEIKLEATETDFSIERQMEINIDINTHTHTHTHKHPECVDRNLSIP